MPKTKHMVTGRLVEEEDLAPIVLEEGEVEAVEELHTWDPWSKALEGWMQMYSEEWHRHQRLWVLSRSCLF